jgi:hypothetical protein
MKKKARVINDNRNNDKNNWQYIFYPFYDQNESHWRVKLYPICFIFLLFNLPFLPSLDVRHPLLGRKRERE